MKVVIFSRFPTNPDQPRGGVESVTVVLVRALARLADMDVHVVTLDREREETNLTREGEVTVHRLPASGWPQIADIMFGPGRRRLLRYMLDLQPDVIHAHETYGLTFSDLPVPHVFTVHGFDHANLVADAARLAWVRSRLWRWAERFGLSRQRHVISISPYVRSMVAPLTSAEIHDIDNPVNERFFSAPRQRECGRVLCVGWISHRKNTLGAVEAFARAVQHQEQGTLAIAGQPKEDTYLQEVKACIRRHGLDDRVEFLGHVGHDRLLVELARADVLLLPSRQENSPMAIAEAMAVGVPVIAANRCGMPFMVEEGRSGYLVDPENTREIADRLMRLLGEPEKTEEMGRLGRGIAEARFHPDVVARKTREVYQHICSLSGALECAAAGETVT